MKFSLPTDVQAQVRRYDPQVRALAELEEALNKPAPKPRKTREYRRGNPANLIPLDVIDDDETVALQMYQEMIKSISDDTDTTAGHIIYSIIQSRPLQESVHTFVTTRTYGLQHGFLL